VENGRRKRPVKRPENPVREWISDNLRYIMLFGGIALAVVIIVVVVRAFGPSGQEDGAQQGSQITSEISGESSLETSQETEDMQAEEPEASITTQPESTSEPSGQAQDGTEAVLETAGADVENVVSTYLNALAAGDTQTAASVLETMSAEDAAAIEQGLFSDSYSNFSVYTYPGEEEGSYVAFVRYEYTYPGYDTLVPALTQFYLFTAEDGRLLIASAQTQQAKAEYMESLLEREDVSELINTVRGEYDAALASDPSLAQYIATH
jgi:hypothetical protein